MMNNASSASLEWRYFDRLRHRVFDWIVIFLGAVGSFAICRLSLHNRSSALAWSLVLYFYFFFYRRMAQVIFWSWHTFRLLRRRSEQQALTAQEPRTEQSDWLPTFHILIASYKAGQSIGPVIKAVANQDYPKDRFCAWVITERSEIIKAREQADKLSRIALDENADGEQREKLATFYWHCISQRSLTLSDWVQQTVSGDLRGWLNHPDVEPLVLKDLLSWLLRIESRQAVYETSALALLELQPDEIVVIEQEVKRIEENVSRIIADFSRLLGSDEIYERSDLETHFIAEAIKKEKLKRIGSRIRRRFYDASIAGKIPERLEIERSARQVNSSTQDAIITVMESLAASNVRHLDPHNRGFKPGALNAAYRQMKEEGLLERPENVYFIIIDSDSLLPRHALSAIAEETARADQRHMLMQMASLPTANFFSGDWYSKFVCFGDAIGAVGKWARSTRRQLKPDLQAGSGVVVPATLSEFIERQTGSAWDESTLTEDARLIIGQFGMMNDARNKTKMAPVGLLEAVPEDKTFRGTYRSFWNQRRRWSAGGYDETFYMLSSPGWLRHSRFNAAESRWETYLPDRKARIWSRIRQAHRLWLWLWDHFIWGIGGFIVLTHWWLISTVIGSPGALLSNVGFATMFLLPLLFLLTSARQLSWFIPGGLSKSRMVALYFQTFFAIWLYAIPVVVIQTACILGFRSRIVEWKPTQKPRYQIGAILDLEE
jgi:cellulose synthase/poly-beta-1,6-N-acetylglucosamine synthase-like glycosyltransferase